MSTTTPDAAPLTVVLVHGAFTNASSWNGVIERARGRPGKVSGATPRPNRESGAVQRQSNRFMTKGAAMPEETSSNGSTAEQVLPDAGFAFDKPRAALVVIDPQNDFLSPDGAGWPVFGRGVTENNVVANLARLFQAADSSDMTVAVSPHYHYPADGEWRVRWPSPAALERTSHVRTLGATDGRRPPWVRCRLPRAAQAIHPRRVDRSSSSPHKIWGPQTNDLALQLRKRGVSQIVLAGMAANLCVESHLRHLLEEGFEVVVVRDATAAPRVAAGDAYLAALTNYSFLANAMWMTEEAVSHIRGGGVHSPAPVDEVAATA